MKFSVIIPTYNRRKTLARTLPTVLAQNFPATDFEVIVVVDGSTDGSAQWLRTLTPDCNLRVLVQPNRGLAAARNRGLQAAAGDLVLFLDDDVRCEKYLLKEHLAAHQATDPAVVVGPVHLAPESPRKLLTCHLEQFCEDWIRRLSRESPHWLPEDMAIGNNSSTPRLALLGVGGYDEHLAGAFEDFDLGLRVRDQGLTFQFQPGAVTYQIYEKSTHAYVKDDSKWYGRNSVLLSRKHPEFRSHSILARLGEEAFWIRVPYQLALRAPFSLDPLLAALTWTAERLRCFQWALRGGIWLLKLRRALEAARSALAEMGSWEAARAEFGMRLPVLLYPRVSRTTTRSPSEQVMSPERFARHLRWLVRRGYTGIRPFEWLNWVRQGIPLPKKPVLLTFEDISPELNDYVLPLLRQHGFSAGIFVGTGLLAEASNSSTKAMPEEPDFGGGDAAATVDVKQLRHWAAEGIEFGAQSRTRRDLTKLAAQELEEEVAGSHKDLRSVLGAPADCFAYPCGKYDPAVLSAVRRAFRMAFTRFSGVNGLKTDLFTLRGIVVRQDDSVLDLAFRIHFG